MPDERIENINAIAELERIGWAWESRGGDEIVMLCPVHDDTHPSLNLNVKKRRFQCKAASCNFQGDIISLLAAMMHVQRPTMIAKLLEFYDLHVVKSINPEQIEKYHAKIFHLAGPLYQALQERGIDAELVKKARLGFHDGRITIPIYDKERRIVNVRKYLPGAPGPEKFRDTKGYAAIRFYMPEQLEYDSIWLCGGEMKALAATKILNPQGIGALCVTSGEGAWHKDLTPKIKNKVIYVCMDVDTGGISAANKLGGQLLRACKGLYIIHLPLDQAFYPKGDLNDWIMTGAKFKDFKKLMDDAHQFKIKVAEIENLEEISVRLQDAASATNMGKKILCDGLICTMNHIPYLVPKKVKITCGRQQPNCERCPVALVELSTNGSIDLEVQGTAAGILGHIDIPESRTLEATKVALDIPFCKDVELETLESYAVYDSHLTAQLDIHHGGNSEHIIQPAFIVTNSELKLNMPYEFSGRVYPHPKTQQAVLLLDGLSETPDNLDSYLATEKELTTLEVFQSKFSIKGIQEKLDEIYEDLEANVTRIFHRRNLHFALDLTWHSCLYFDFDNRRQNGWINTLVTGDSSQGKSEASMRLLEHYELGTRFDCKRATTAGLLGGVQTIGGRFYTSWGVIPAHDRQLVILEEIKGMEMGVLGSLTDMRSTGIAELVKIEKRRAHARTRLVMISNPRDNKPVASQPCGITMLSKLIGTPEDIRRFDLAIILSAMAIDSKEINRLQNDCPKVPPVYTSELCKRLILFAWTRTAEQIQFDAGAIKQCITSAIHLCDTFTEVIPLVDSGTMRFKLARMAIALALRTYSSDGDLVFVKKCHVEYIAKFVEQQYTEASFGYDDFSNQQDFHSKIPDEATVIKEIHNTHYPKDFVNHMLVTDDIIHDDLADWCDVDWTASKSIMSLFSRKHCVVREGRVYKKTPAFIALLKKMKQKGIPEKGIASGKF